jgi:CheY-like chemotaxis protein
MPCVLIVEDDPDTRQMLAMLLTHESYEVMTAANGREALAAMRERRPCLVLLDLMMPVMNGWDFRREQLADPKLADVPVRCLTAVFDIGRVADELNLRCFRKPVVLDDILNEVEAVCGPR